MWIFEQAGKGQMIEIILSLGSATRKKTIGRSVGRCCSWKGDNNTHTLKTQYNDGEWVRHCAQCLTHSACCWGISACNWLNCPSDSLVKGTSEFLQISVNGI
ncbi:MAG: hypothetical protein LBE56_01040 [Tannerella sp.]|nr:hypothetical protein [Tannerella sp.]